MINTFKDLWRNRLKRTGILWILLGLGLFIGHHSWQPKTGYDKVEAVASVLLVLIGLHMLFFSKTIAKRGPITG